MSNAVNHPKHYKHASGVECIDIAENIGFNLGNALKYVWRRNDKGKPIEDLKKAEFYLIRFMGHISVKQWHNSVEQCSFDRALCQRVILCDHSILGNFIAAIWDSDFYVALDLIRSEIRILKAGIKQVSKGSK